MVTLNVFCTRTGENTLGLSGIRTHDLPITSRMLYQLSYRPLKHIGPEWDIYEYKKYAMSMLEEYNGECWNV